MTFMEFIRRKGAWFLAIFLVIFVIGLAYGLTVGGYGSVNTPGGGKRPDGAETPGSPLLVADGDWKDTALKVNGHKVSQQQFEDTYRMIVSSSRMPGNMADMALDAYNYTAQYLGEQELILAKGEELGVEVTAADLKQARTDAAAAYVQGLDGKKGNVVSDVFSGLEKRKSEKAAFGLFLQASGLSEEQWEVEARRNLLVENTRKKIQEAADAELKTKMETTKAEIDAKLKEGKKFADLAKEYSDDDRKAEGGEMGWIGAGLLQKDTDYYEAQRKALFDTPVGQISEWVDIPAGFVRYEIYDRKKAEGADYEAKKAELIEQIKAEHTDDPDYAPTDDEIKERYDQVAARQIMLRTSAPDKFTEEITKLKDSATFEYNHIYVLVHQALSEPKLQPPSSVDAAQLETIAKMAAVGEGYDYQLIKDKLDAGKPASEPGLVNVGEGGDLEKDAAADGAEAPADEATETPDTAADTATPAPAADPEAEAAAKVDIPQADENAGLGPDGQSPPTPTTPEVFNLAETPLYALAIGLLDKAAQNEGATATSLPHYLIAKQYAEWLDNEEMLKLQPIERDKAREAIAKELEIVVEKDNYNADAYAMSGVNLAWLDKKDEAYKQLDLAIKYAKQEEGPTWDMIKKAYEIFDDQAKLDMVNEKITAFRQAKLQEMIEQAQAQQDAQQTAPPVDVPIEVPVDDAAPPADGAGDTAAPPAEGETSPPAGGN